MSCNRLFVETILLEAPCSVCICNTHSQEALRVLHNSLLSAGALAWFCAPPILPLCNTVSQCTARWKCAACAMTTNQLHARSWQHKFHASLRVSKRCNLFLIWANVSCFLPCNLNCRVGLCFIIKCCSLLNQMNGVRQNFYQLKLPNLHQKILIIIKKRFITINFVKGSFSTVLPKFA